LTEIPVILKTKKTSLLPAAEKNNTLFVNGCKTPGLDINRMTNDGLHLDAVASKKLIEPVVKLMMNK